MYELLNLSFTCRHEDYLHALWKSKVIPLSIVTPLHLDPMVDVLSITKKCLDNNFISSFLTVAGAVILLHYESILELQDECPLILCFSTMPGTGDHYIC